MKPLVLIACSVFSICFAQVSSTCDSSYSLLPDYSEDVKGLALKRIFDIESNYVDSIRIPSSYQDTIFSGLSAIFNTSLLERDSIFDIYCIHNFITNAPIYYNIDVIIDGSQDTSLWNWFDFNIVTDNNDLNNFMNEYGFEILNTITSDDIVRFRTNQTINAIAFCNKLETFTGIEYAEVSSVYGDGNRIDYNKIGYFMFFDFSVGFESCPSGCINRKYWSFKVNYFDCSVELLSDTLSIINTLQTFPSPSNCNITSSNNSTFQTPNSINQDIKNHPLSIYPNPTSGLVSLNHEEFIKSEVFDISGKLLLNSSSKNIDLSSFNKGIYIFNVHTKKEIIQQKIIKE